MLKISALKVVWNQAKCFIDTEEQRIISDEEIKQRVATELPYDEWVKEHVIHLSEITQADESDIPKVDDLFKNQQAFGYTQEDLVRMIVPMAKRW